MKNSELISKLDPGILQKFEEKQIRYVRYLPDKTRHEYMNWQHAFATEDREVKHWGLCCNYKPEYRNPSPGAVFSYLTFQSTVFV